MIGKQMKDLAWNTFKQTGDINTFMEFMQIKNMENGITQNKEITNTTISNEFSSNAKTNKEM